MHAQEGRMKVKTSDIKGIEVTSWGKEPRFYIVARMDDGEEYALNRPFVTGAQAARVVARIFERGEIDLDLWTFQGPDFDAMADRAAEEAAERRAWDRSFRQRVMPWER
jgi:hypothetical protein